MTRRHALLVVLILIGAAAGFAQGFDDIFGESGTDAPTDTSADAGISPGVAITGNISAQFDYYFDDEWDSEVEMRPTADIDIVASADSASALLSLDVATSQADDGALSGNLIDELSVTSFFGAGRLTAGLTRIEWGSGDGLHAIDVLNPIDQTNGPVADYLSSRRAEAMLDLNLYLGSSGNLELVYKPFFHPTEVAMSGRWMVVDPATIPGFSSITPVDVRTLMYSQGAARLSGSLGPADLGVMYYYGFMPEPGYEFTTTFLGGDPMDPANYLTTAELVYTRAQLFGGDVAAALGPFTVRAEAGYWLSEDTDGTAPERYNSRLVYLGGFDVSIPGTTAFVSAQVQGSWTVNATDLDATDVDRFRLYEDFDTSHLIVAAVEAPFARDTMNIRIAGMYAPEAGGFIVMPEYSWTIADGVELSLSGKVIGGKELGSANSPYYAWRDNDSVSVSVSYQF